MIGIASFFALGIIVVIFVLLVLLLYYFPIGLWIRTMAAGVPLSHRRADTHAPDRHSAQV